jgi:hypothetical protein
MKFVQDDRWRKRNKDLSSSFLAERMGIEKDPTGADEPLRDDDYGLSQSKSGCIGSEPGIFHAVTFLVRVDHSSLWDRRLRHFPRSILSQVPA